MKKNSNVVYFITEAPKYGERGWGDYIKEFFSEENKYSLNYLKVGNPIEVSYKRRIKTPPTLPIIMEDRVCKGILLAVYEDKKYFVVKTEYEEVSIYFCEVTKL